MYQKMGLDESIKLMYLPLIQDSKFSFLLKFLDLYFLADVKSRKLIRNLYNLTLAVAQRCFGCLFKFFIFDFLFKVFRRKIIKIKLLDERFWNQRRKFSGHDGDTKGWLDSNYRLIIFRKSLLFTFVYLPFLRSHLSFIC